MNRQGPIFIIGSYRSGTSVLTWCLGQHRNILPLEETNWISRLAVDCDYLYHLGTANGKCSHLTSFGIKRRDFSRFIGNVVNKLMEENKYKYIRKSILSATENLDVFHKQSVLYQIKQVQANNQSILDMDGVLDQSNYMICRSKDDPKKRWIDGTPENSHYVYGLAQVFPDAKFIHILRNPKQVARSLMHFSTMGQIDYSEEQAYRTWTRLVSDSARAEKALGSKRVLRVYYDDLVNNPRQLLETCLKFVQEDFSEDCLQPLTIRINSSTYKRVNDDSIEENIESTVPYIKEAFELYKDLLNETNPSDRIRLSLYREIRKKFFNYTREQRPENIEALGKWGAALDEQIKQKDQQIIELKREIQTKIKPIHLIEYGPKEITAGSVFNKQLNGESAIWLKTENATSSTVVMLNEVPLKTAVEGNGNLVTAEVPIYLYKNPGKYQLYLFDTATDYRSNEISFIVKK